MCILIYMTYTTNTNTTAKFGYASDGAVRQDGSLPITTCRHCGNFIVWATSNRTNKKYPCDVHHGYKGQQFYIKANFHKCDPHRVELHTAAENERQVELDHRIADGEIVKGQTVEIIKGRKHPKGTTGKVFWIADQPDSWGVIKIGIKTDTDDKLWVNIDNVRATNLVPAD